MTNIFANFFETKSTKIKYIILFVLGLLAVFALAPFHIWPLYATAIWGFMIALDDARKNAKPLKSAFWRAFIFGFAHFALGMFWVGQAFLVDAEKFAWLIPFAMSALPAFIGIYYGIAGLLYAKFAPKNANRVFWFAFCFGAIEYLRSILFTGLPWNLSAYIWKAGGIISQSGALIGPFGVGLLTILVFASLNIIREGKSKLIIILDVVIIAFSIGFGAWRLNNATQFDNANKIAVGQAGFSQKDLWDSENRENVINNYIGQLNTKTAKDANIIVWPEGAFPFDLFTDAEALSKINPLIKDKVLIVGAPHADFVDPNKYFNSIAFLTGSNDIYPSLLSTYDKFHLVPFGEYLPLRPFFNTLGISSLVAYGTDFSKGESPKVLKIGNLPNIDPRICYEIIFPHFNNGQIRPDMIVNVSVDAWYGDYLGPDQHYNQARWRAIEEGLPLIRAASGGWSGIIDAFGRPISQFRKGNDIISANLPSKLTQTPYSRYSDAIFLLLMVVFAANTYLTRKF